jgi:hypothetical protein
LRVSQAELNSYLDDSSLLEKRVYPEEVEEGYDDEYQIDLDKAWDGVYFCLSGYGTANANKVPQPLCWIISADNIIDEEQDLGYGYAIYSTVEQVMQVAAYLEKVSDDDFIAGFDAKKMAAADLYPSIWDEGEEVKDYLIYYYKLLKEFYLKAAKEDMAVISYFN